MKLLVYKQMSCPYNQSKGIMCNPSYRAKLGKHSEILVNCITLDLKRIMSTFSLLTFARPALDVPSLAVASSMFTCECCLGLELFLENLQLP